MKDLIVNLIGSRLPKNVTVALLALAIPSASQAAKFISAQNVCASVLMAIKKTNGVIQSDRKKNQVSEDYLYRFMRNHLGQGDRPAAISFEEVDANHELIQANSKIRDQVIQRVAGILEWNKKSPEELRAVQRGEQDDRKTYTVQVRGHSKIEGFFEKYDSYYKTMEFLAVFTPHEVGQLVQEAERAGFVFPSLPTQLRHYEIEYAAIDEWLIYGARKFSDSIDPTTQAGKKELAHLKKVRQQVARRLSQIKTKYPLMRSLDNIKKLLTANAREPSGQMSGPTFNHDVLFSNYYHEIDFRVKTAPIGPSARIAKAFHRDKVKVRDQSVATYRKLLEGEVKKPFRSSSGLLGDLMAGSGALLFAGTSWALGDPEVFGIQTLLSSIVAVGFAVAQPMNKWFIQRHRRQNPGAPISDVFERIREIHRSKEYKDGNWIYHGFNTNFFKVTLQLAEMLRTTDGVFTVEDSGRLRPLGLALEKLKMSEEDRESLRKVWSAVDIFYHHDYSYQEPVLTLVFRTSETEPKTPKPTYSSEDEKDFTLEPERVPLPLRSN